MRDRDRRRALSAREGRFLVLGVLVLPFVTVGVRIAGFDAVRGIVARLAPRSDRRNGDPDRPLEVARMIEIAGRRGIVRATCVPQALLTWGILRREGFEVSIRIGVRRDGELLRAHAWVEHRGEPLEAVAIGEGGFAPLDHDFATSGSRPA